ncbi:MAG: UbiA family prenyltransferase [Pirellulales bacterium]|nr:UbiA family prenyltransferase [Pirellulales bacterium]
MAQTSEQPRIGDSTHGLTRAYLQLVRLPNVFTAMADILMGYLFTHQMVADPAGSLALLLGASAALYMAGMVLNDLFDFEIDARERPHRPLPSGRIHASTARAIGIGLVVFGVVMGWLAGWLGLSWRPGLVATALAALVVIYDASLRVTPLAPLGMAGCRALNVLLGMSLAPGDWHAAHYVIAAGVGVYILGVTWFSRGEAEVSRRLQLSMALAVLLSGIALLASYPLFVDEFLPAVSQPVYLDRWRLLMLLLGGLIAWRCVRAIITPAPLYVQAAVKNCILSLIVLDAAVCFTVRGAAGALPILVLLIPALFLGRWVYST